MADVHLFVMLENKRRFRPKAGDEIQGGGFQPGVRLPKMLALRSCVRRNGALKKPPTPQDSHARPLTITSGADFVYGAGLVLLSAPRFSVGIGPTAGVCCRQSSQVGQRQ